MEETSRKPREEVQEAGLGRRFLWAKLGPRSGDAGKVFVPAEGSGAGGSAWCSVPEEERTGTGKNPRRNSATPSTSITTQHTAKVPEPNRIVPTRRAGIPAPWPQSDTRPAAAASGSREEPQSKRWLAGLTGANPVSLTSGGAPETRQTSGHFPAPSGPDF